MSGYSVGQEVTVVIENLGGSYIFKHQTVVKVGKNSIVLDDGRSFLRSGRLRGAPRNSWSSVPLLVGRNEGLQREAEFKRLQNLRNILPEYRRRWLELDAKYPLWIPGMKKKAEEFVAWLNTLDLSEPESEKET